MEITQEKYGMRNLQEASNQMLQSYGQHYTLTNSSVSPSFDDEKVADPTPQPIIESPIQKVQGEISLLCFLILVCLQAFVFFHGAPKALLVFYLPQFFSFLPVERSTLLE